MADGAITADSRVPDLEAGSDRAGGDTEAGRPVDAAADARAPDAVPDQSKVDGAPPALVPDPSLGHEGLFIGMLTTGSQGEHRFKPAVSFRFRAPLSGPLEHIRWHRRVNNNCEDSPAYSYGTGGSVRVSIFEDDGAGGKSGAAIAESALMTQLYSLGCGDKPVTQPLYVDAEAAVKKNASLVGGKFYVVEFRNHDSDPERNYASINLAINMHGALLDNPPRPPNAYWNYLPHVKRNGVTDFRYATGGWSIRVGQRDYGSPYLMSLGYELDKYTGCTAVACQASVTVTGSRTVRQKLKTPFTATVDQVHAYLWRRSGTKDLVITLQAGCTGALAKATVPASAIALNSATGYSSGSGVVDWTVAPIKPPVQLVKDATYCIELSTASGGEYVVQGMMNDIDFYKGSGPISLEGYVHGGAADNRAELWNGSAWVGFSLWTQVDRDDVDLPIALRVKSRP